MFSALIWLVILTLIVFLFLAKNPNSKENSLFLIAFFAKIFSSTIFNLVYTGMFDGGDTYAYWQGAVNLNNLFYFDFSSFLIELTHSGQSMGENFNVYTGYPPGWIYREPESFYVSKLTVILSFLTIRSYYASTYIVSFLMMGVSWHFYQSIKRLDLFNVRWLPVVLFFSPTILFWCSGISKDTYVLMALLLCLSLFIRLYFFRERSFLNYFFLVLTLFLILQIRSYIIIAMIPAILMAYSAKLTKDHQDSAFRKNSIRFLFFTVALGTFILYYQFLGGAEQIEKVLNEIIVTQQDFANNQTYGGKRYDVGLGGFELVDLAKSTPTALIAAFYRPYIWEALSPLLFLTGIENFLLIILTILFLGKNPLSRVSLILSNETLMFIAFFILVMGFSIGFTSGLFGVLVRFKSIILPFFILLLMAREKVDTPNATV